MESRKVFRCPAAPLRANSEIAVLMKDATSFLSGLSPVEGKLLTATFNAGRLSSDGGILKIGVRVEQLKSRIKLAFPASWA